MGDKKARLGAGDVKVVLCGEELVLEPSLEACMAISKMAGNSLVAAMQKCSRLDFEFISEVLALGIGATSPALKKTLLQQIYETGLIAVAPSAILFIRTVMNGGRTPEDDEAATSLDLLDQLGGTLPSDFSELFTLLEPLRNALLGRIQEAGEEIEDPLAPAKQSRSENTTAD